MYVRMKISDSNAGMAQTKDRLCKNLLDLERESHMHFVSIGLISQSHAPTRVEEERTLIFSRDKKRRRAVGGGGVSLSKLLSDVTY